MKILLSRLGGLILVLSGTSLITFAVAFFAPGDRALAIAHARYPGGMGFAPEILAGIRKEFFLDQPFLNNISEGLRIFSAVILASPTVPTPTSGSSLKAILVKPLPWPFARLRLV